MFLEIGTFLHLSVIDILDVLLVALLIFFVFKWMRNSSALNIFLAIILIFLMKLVVDALNMKLTGVIIGTFIDVGVIALIVIFQPEIRHFLMKVGSSRNIAGSAILGRILGHRESIMGNDTVKEITEACRRMSSDKTGALIVLPRKDGMEHIIETGDKIDSCVSRRLIMNLFFKNSPLHDGAVIMKDDRIVAARCTLPITSRTDIPANFGMRHKAAIGISEETDADVIVVSEETGRISFVRGGKVKEIGNINELKLLLGSAVQADGGDETEGKEHDV